MCKTIIPVKKENKGKLKNYYCFCPICGVKHTKKSIFLSVSRSITATDGKEYLALTCGKHSQKEIKKAWKKPLPRF